MKNKLFLLFLLFSLNTFSQKKSADTSHTHTPFDPKSNYQTFAIRLRALPWVIGNDGGINTLVGIQIGFRKYHSASIDMMNSWSTANVDNDSVGGPSKYRTETKTEFHFSYNYHFTFESLRKSTGLSFYSGINFRIGQSHLSSDSSMYMDDNTLNKERKYYSLGPQIGVFWNLKTKRNFALNINIAPIYNIKDDTTTSQDGANIVVSEATFKTVDLRVGLNLIYWLKYGVN